MLCSVVNMLLHAVRCCYMLPRLTCCAQHVMLLVYMMCSVVTCYQELITCVIHVALVTCNNTAQHYML